MKKYDVIIVGAGVSGLIAANYLAKNNKKILVIEKEKQIGNKLCAGGLTYKAVAFLKNAPFISKIDLKKIITSKSNTYSIKYRQKEVVSGKSDYPYYFTHRSILDNILLKKAIENNIEIIFDNKVLEIKNNRIIKTPKGSFRAERIICARGVSEFFKNNIKNGDFYFTMQTEFSLKEFDKNTPTNFIYGYVSRGYGWIFPTGKKVVVGIGSRDVYEVKKAFYKMCKDLKLNILNKTIKGAWIPCFEKKEIIKGKIIYVGDSLAATSPIFGEGIYNAFLSGKIAAEIILKNKENNKYKKEIKKHILNKNKFEMLIIYIFYKLLKIFKHKLLYFFMTKLGREIFLIAHGKISYLKLFLSGRFFLRLLR
ncbi:MAG: NAD(P)/FAD-dependent oxidoreductase [Candidatus Muirbacterium halophilum]|nr:NAD(P)/FAD-dependent oxidoreductase [Candidatus Muirbacterium halophilum]MCK9474546.1 NAD(P)/FAD-dependent oxidoreductase [Candidatus Muirbacterium halophilum]